MQTLINPEILAQRLEIAAEQYERDAAVMRNPDPKVLPQHLELAKQFDRQAAESRAWADALRNVEQLGFGGNDEIELIDHR